MYLTPMSGHPVIVEIFPCGPRWWIEWQKSLAIQRAVPGAWIKHEDMLSWTWTKVVLLTFLFSFFFAPIFSVVQQNIQIDTNIQFSPWNRFFVFDRRSAALKPCVGNSFVFMINSFYSFIMCITTHPRREPSFKLCNLNQAQSALGDVKPDFKAAADKLGPDPWSLVREAQEVGCLLLPSSGIHQDKQWTTPNPHPSPPTLLLSLSPSFTLSPTSMPPWDIHPGEHSNTKPIGYHVVNYSTLTNPPRSLSPSPSLGLICIRPPQHWGRNPAVTKAKQHVNAWTQIHCNGGSYVLKTPVST